MSETGANFFEWPSIHLAARVGGVREVMRKIENGADINGQDADGNTLLHLSTWNNHEKLARALVEMDAALDIQDKDGNTPLHIAAYIGDAELVELLLVLGVKKEIKNFAGKTPIDRAEEFNMQTSHYKIISLLKD